MAKYSIYFRESVAKDFRTIHGNDINKILHRINRLTGEPRPAGCEKQTGHERYRLRQGKYRILYSIQDDEKTIWIVKVGNRRDVYRKK